ncbi:MAG: hypothetical protein ACLU38_00200 [Dysosmobacter sp.]
MGRVEQVPGGVSRNVVEDIANVELRPTFVSLVDDTGMGRIVSAAATEPQGEHRLHPPDPGRHGGVAGGIDNHGDVAPPSPSGLICTLAAPLDERVTRSSGRRQHRFWRSTWTRNWSSGCSPTPQHGIRRGVQRRVSAGHARQTVCNLQEAGILFSDD